MAGNFEEKLYTTKQNKQAPLTAEATRNKIRPRRGVLRQRRRQSGQFHLRESPCLRSATYRTSSKERLTTTQNEHAHHALTDSDLDGDTQKKYKNANTTSAWSSPQQRVHPPGLFPARPMINKTHFRTQCRRQRQQPLVAIR